jgi:polygalacturonase
MRPNLLSLFWIDGLVIDNLHLVNSPFWNVHPVFSKHIRITNMDIYAPPDSHVCIHISLLMMQ